MRRLLLILALCALPCMGQAVRPTNPASVQVPCKPGLQLVGNNLEIVNCKGKAKVIGGEPSPDAAATAPSPLQQEAMDAQLKYQIYSWKHAQEVFECQYWSGIVIFWVSVLLVVAGLVFAAWQLRYSMRLGVKRMQLMDAHAAVLNAAAAAGNEAAANAVACEPSDTTLKISATGLEVHSATLGVIILAFSMGFFYMYLKYVYPIQLVPTSVVTQTHH
jgi:hypothetical protein